MPYTNNQAKKEAKAAQKLDSSVGAVKEASTNALGKPTVMKYQKENAARIQNASISTKANGGKGPKDKIAPIQESQCQKDKAPAQTKGPSKRAEAKSKVGKA